MGGIGVEHCSRPSYRNPNYHPWANKKVLPASFVHGTALTVSCWNERFESFRSTMNVGSETLHCVNGNWFNTLNTAELGKFTCQPCVMVGGDGYSKYAKRKEQELYFFSRLAMRVFTELGSVVETSAAAHKFCLKKAASGSGMMLENSQQCPEILAIQLMGNAEIQERMMKLLKDGAMAPVWDGSGHVKLKAAGGERDHVLFWLATESSKPRTCCCQPVLTLY